MYYDGLASLLSGVIPRCVDIAVGVAAAAAVAVVVAYVVQDDEDLNDSEEDFTDDEHHELRKLSRSVNADGEEEVRSGIIRAYFEVQHMYPFCIFFGQNLCFLNFRPVFIACKAVYYAIFF